MKRKTFLQKFINKNFQGSYIAAANKMVILFCKEYGIAGSAHGYDFYTNIQKSWEEILKEESEEVKKWESKLTP